MILTCPSCATRYSIDAITIGPEGRAVKCAKCGHKWREYPPTDMPKTLTEPPPAVDSAPPQEQGMSIEQMTKGQAPGPAKVASGKPRRWIAWLLLLLVLAALVGGAYFGRNYVVMAWPASAQMYQYLRIDVETQNMLGLEIHDLRTKSVLQNGVTTLTVSGIIKNITDSPQPLPRIKIALIDAEGQSVYSWTTTVEEPEVMPWGQVEFSSSMNQPPEEAKNVKVDLIDPEN
ncbi:DUF3426 domain-containing protein [Sneathiella chungangensis]|uniref:DUF3426 domain-containing protein n=1 Tax=Sneathiella chungangensis TaxID=1418234 RepID=A0A845ML14_9PROT|nr:DUF3426 domain-containing protein [Sneathiella chungangensis]MZR24255.1 DUF3426 domain-containing protein [Sneathiella chungangensis]